MTTLVKADMGLCKTPECFNQAEHGGYCARCLDMRAEAAEIIRDEKRQRAEWEAMHEHRWFDREDA